MSEMDGDIWENVKPVEFYEITINTIYTPRKIETKLSEYIYFYVYDKNEKGMSILRWNIKNKQMFHLSSESLKEIFKPIVRKEKLSKVRSIIKKSI